VTLSAEQRQQRLNRPCKRCGKPLNSLVKSQTVCCGAGCLGWASPVQVNCKVCVAEYQDDPNGVELESLVSEIKDMMAPPYSQATLTNP
jgi:hypothetical protein